MNGKHICYRLFHGFTQVQFKCGYSFKVMMPYSKGCILSYLEIPVLFILMWIFIVLSHVLVTNHFGSLFYDAFVVTRLYSVYDRMTSE
jgi:hypothetical protein